MIYKVLKKYWGYDSFRLLQKQIIDSVMEGNDTLGIMPTGGGKSLTFQIPGLVREGMVIVVTPLISLMKDQVENLKTKKIQAVFFHSGMTMKERNLAYERIYNRKCKFIYISPERLLNENFLFSIRNIKLNLITVDEAHCISQWGHDFRPSYLKIRKLRKIFPKVPVLALTASATNNVEKDICSQLEFKAGSKTFRSSIFRENLSYVVRRSDGKLFDIEKILNAVKGSAIVYVRSRKRSREISEYLNNAGIKSSFYHAAVDPLLKEERQNQWKNEEIRVMVATNAFGMGIDKSNVRTVIHFDMPPSIEEYYQEAGRAGRDGKPSYAVLLTSSADKSTLRKRLNKEFPEKEVIKHIYSRLCVFSHLALGEGYDVSAEFDIIKFCNTFHLDESTVRSSIRILSKAGYIDFFEDVEHSSRLMIKMDRNELYNLKLTDSFQDKLITALLRNYPGIFSDYVFINEKRLALSLQYDTEIVYQNLVSLSKQKVVNYIPRKKSSYLYFPTAMEEEKYLIIGKEVYEDRKKRMSERIESIINYGFNESECRTGIIKRYFGESEGIECGCCDWCRSKKKKINESSQFSYKLNALFKANNGILSENDLKEFFGSNNYSTVIDILRRLNCDGIVTKTGQTWKLK